MPLSKEDTLHAKGIAILGMVMLHLFCRLGELPYTPWIWIGNVPLIYYFGLFGDICVPIFCFCSGYAHYLQREKLRKNYACRIPGKMFRFLLNYWIVVIVFAVLGLLFDKTGDIPGSFGKFLGNMLVVGINYNGAWWFVSTYLFLLILSPILYRITQSLPGLMLVLVGGVVYFIAYLFRFNYVVELENPVANWFLQQLILLGTSQFPYILGMLAYRYKIPEKMRRYFQNSNNNALKWIIVIGLPLMAFIAHGIVQSVIVAPITAMMVLVSLTLVNLPEWLASALAFLGKHSTNIWLTHMFFYLTLFPGLVFKVGYPVLIVLYMLVLCIGVSYVIDFVYRPICRKIG